MKKNLISLFCVVALSCSLVPVKHINAENSYSYDQDQETEDLKWYKEYGAITLVTMLYLVGTVGIDSAMSYFGVSKSNKTLLKFMVRSDDFSADMLKQLVLPALSSGAGVWLIKDYIVWPMTNYTKRKLQQQKAELSRIIIAEYLQSIENDIELQIKNMNDELSELLSLNLSNNNDIETLKIISRGKITRLKSSDSKESFLHYPLVWIELFLCGARDLYSSNGFNGKCGDLTTFIIDLRKTKQFQQEQHAFEVEAKEIIARKLKEKEIEANTAVALGYERNTKAVEKLDNGLSNNIKQFNANNKTYSNQNSKHECSNQRQAVNNQEQDGATKRTVSASEKLGNAGAALLVQSFQLAGVGTAISNVQSTLEKVKKNQEGDSRKLDSLKGQVGNVQGTTNQINTTTKDTNMVVKASANRPPAQNPGYSSHVGGGGASCQQPSPSAPPMEKNMQKESNYPGLYPDLNK